MAYGTVDASRPRMVQWMRPQQSAAAARPTPACSCRTAGRRPGSRDGHRASS